MAEQDIPPPTIIAMKIHIIRKGEYDIWSMRIQQYICHIDHNLWDVIVNGDLEEEPAPTRETSAPPAPKTIKQLVAKRNQEIVKSILLLEIHDEYLLKFHNVADDKSLWEAIKSWFGGNEESKKIAQKEIEEEAKVEAAKRKGEIKKEELIDLLGLEVVNNLSASVAEVPSASALQVLKRLGSIFTLVYAAKVYKAGKRLLYVKRNEAISLGNATSKVGLNSIYMAALHVYLRVLVCSTLAFVDFGISQNTSSVIIRVLGLTLAGLVLVQNGYGLVLTSYGSILIGYGLGLNAFDSMLIGYDSDLTNHGPFFQNSNWPLVGYMVLVGIMNSVYAKYIAVDIGLGLFEVDSDPVIICCLVGINSGRNKASVSYMD
ncbi:hypothetical protein Tco_0377669 [Tanacetum coccineum]